jgi:CopA family copper-resistance protein
MKVKILIATLLVVIGLSLPGMSIVLLAQQTTASTKVVYTCPMHPQIQEDKPGSCPICGMTLEKKTIKVKEASPMPDMEMTKSKAPAGMKVQSHETSVKAGGKATSEVGVLKANPPRRVRYDLYIGDSLVNYTNTKRMYRALVVNGQLPAPTLVFTEGDTAEIWVHNNLKEETSIHWHGLLLPNRYDGVSYLTTAPIMPGESHLFLFPLIQNGTYWYHSHTMTQEQDGLYGAFIINKREEPAYKQLPIVLSDWTNMSSHEVDRSLHNATDWFGVRKGTVQSYAEAIQVGAFSTKVKNEWKRMEAMDVSDVYYERFLINGTYDEEKPEYKPGDKIKLRIVNGGSSTYFWLTWAGGKMTVVANDGQDVEPVEVDRLIVAVAETYDVIVTIPDNHSYELLATPEDRTKSTSLWLGSGLKVIAPHLPKLKYFAGMKMMNGMMKMNGNMTGMEGMKMTNQVMDMNTVMYPEITGGSDLKYGNRVSEVKEEETPDNAGKEDSGVVSNMQHNMESSASHESEDTLKNSSGMNAMDEEMEPMKGHYENGKWLDINSGSTGIKTLNYSMLRATKKTNLPDAPTRTLVFELTGNMNRYVWTINNKTVSEADTILIRKGENTRIILYNNTMMRHPMHLHGHFFRVLNGQGDYSPLKNTLDIMPMETDTIEFAATESGDWFFHCHILYHMMSGMGRIFTYENSPPNPEVPDPEHARKMIYMDDRKFHFMANVGLESNGSEGEAMFANTRWKLETTWHLGLKATHGYESETMLGRYFGRMQWWYPYIGFDFHRKKEEMGTADNGMVGSNILGSDTYNLFGQKSNKNNRQTVVAGIRYTLPMLVEADMRIDGNGKLRFQLQREDIAIASRLRFSLMVNTDKEYMAGFRYILTKYLSLSTHYDSDMGLGAGIKITY